MAGYDLGFLLGGWIGAPSPDVTEWGLLHPGDPVWQLPVEFLGDDSSPGLWSGVPGGKAPAEAGDHSTEGDQRLSCQRLSRDLWFAELSHSDLSGI